MIFSGPLGWLIGASIVSAVFAFLLVHVVGKLFELAGIAKAVVFGGIWAAVGTTAGMRSMTGKARKLRANRAVERRQ